jgi:hypothetical protein
MRFYLLIICLIGGVILSAKAQKPDTVTHKNKTDEFYRKVDTANNKRFLPKATKKVKVYHPDSLHSPHTAWTRSAFVPGLGQVYNHQWWKVPAIYAGLGMLVNAAITNMQDYKDFLAVAKFQQLGRSLQDADVIADPNYELYATYSKFPRQSIIDAKDAAYRNRDVSILGILAVWGVNVIDAYIYGKLQHSYSMDNNFSFRVDMGTINQSIYASNFNTTFTPAIKLTITLK